MGGYDYTLHMNDQAMIDFCHKCSRTECEGICAEWKRHWRQLYVKRPEGKRERRPMIEMEAFGETRPLYEWAQMYGIAYHTLYYRIKYGGYDLEDALIAGTARIKGGGDRRVARWNP